MRVCPIGMKQGATDKHYKSMEALLSSSKPKPDPPNAASSPSSAAAASSRQKRVLTPQPLPRSAPALRSSEEDVGRTLPSLDLVRTEEKALGQGVYLGSRTQRLRGIRASIRSAWRAYTHREHG